MIALELNEFEDVVARNNALILDTRPKEDFVKGFIPGSLWIGIDDNFAPWVGALIQDLNQTIVFLALPGREEEVVTRLSRVGYDHAVGFLDGGIASWIGGGKEVQTVTEIGPHDFTNIYDTEVVDVLDVRKQSEFESQHIKGAVNFPLDFIYYNLDQLDKDTEYYVHCQGGYRSVIATSILMAKGFKEVINIQGGFNEIKKSCIKVTEYHEPETML